MKAKSNQFFFPYFFINYSGCHERLVQNKTHRKVAPIVTAGYNSLIFLQQYFFSQPMLSTLVFFPSNSFHPLSKSIIQGTTFRLIQIPLPERKCTNTGMTLIELISASIA